MRPLCIGVKGLLEGADDLEPSGQAIILSLVVCSQVDDGGTLRGTWGDVSLPVTPRRANDVLSRAKGLGIIADYDVTEEHFEVRCLE